MEKEDDIVQVDAALSVAEGDEGKCPLLGWHVSSCCHLYGEKPYRTNLLAEHHVTWRNWQGVRWSAQAFNPVFVCVCVRSPPVVACGFAELGAKDFQ